MKKKLKLKKKTPRTTFKEAQAKYNEKRMKGIGTKCAKHWKYN